MAADDPANARERLAAMGSKDFPKSKWGERGLTSLHAALVARGGFVVLPELLSLAERETLMAECDALVDAMRERGETVDDDADCVVEPFSQQTVPEESQARRDREAYIAARAAALAESVRDGGGAETSGGGSARPPQAPQGAGKILFETIPATLYSALSRGSERPECSEERPEKRPRGAEPAAPSVPDECSGAGRGSEQQAPAGGLFLFNEQFVVKPPRSAARFAWHTDEEEQMGMCLRPPDAPYLSVWCPLDDCNARNGTLRVLPGFREPPGQGAGSNSGDKFPGGGEDGPDAGAGPPPPPPSGEEKASAADGSVLLEVAAGGAVVFSSRLWHCSGPNATDVQRRVFYAQYSEQPITDGSKSTSLLLFAIPCFSPPPAV